MTQDTQAGAGAQPAPAIQPVYPPLQQECADYATSLRSTTMQVKLEGRPEPQSMVRAADLFERAASRITELDASASQLIEERDHAQDMADRLAQAISEEFRVDVGEHSNLNCPWHQALAVLNGEYTTDSDKDRCIAVQAGALAGARAEAKHWRSNHDNVVARLRIFTQRPDIPKELADRLPWYRELVRLQEVEAQSARTAAPLPAVELVGIKDGQETSLGQVAMPPTLKARDLLREYGFSDFEDDMSPGAYALWAMESLIEYCQRYYAAAAPAAAVPVLYVSPAQLEKHLDLEGAENAEAGRYLPARKTPAGNFTQPLYALAAAPAQTVALPSEVELPDVEDMAHSAVQEALSFGVNHDVFHRWLRAVMDKTVQALAAGAAQAPEQWIDDPHDIEQGRMLNPEWVRAQEHATQLAGQALPADEFRGDTASLVRNIVALLDLDAQGCLVPHGVGGHARGLLSAAASRLAAAPVQPQEDARDPVRALIATHAEMLEDNAYAYFELAYTRQTGWMAWITDKPLYGAPIVNPDRKVLANGQGDTPDEACADAARAAQGGAA